PSLLNLELTESAYTDNPAAMKKVMSKLQGHGFTIMMDDFGSGYSSLSLLKDIQINVLKIDMRFLSVSEFPGRGENIVASVIRMAKWLSIPVIAEGAETAQQVDFLRSVGCDYVQGYYFARPMPVAAYERLCTELSFDAQGLTAQKAIHDRYEDLFSFDPEMKSLFGNTLQAAVIYEFSDDKIEPIRVNEAYYALLGHEDMLANAPNMLDLIDPEYREPLLNLFRACAKSQSVVEGEYTRSRAIGNPVWIHTRLHYASMVGNKHILIGELTDITLRRALDLELQKYKASWLKHNRAMPTLLLVDDEAVNLQILEKILEGQFQFSEAENGQAALKRLEDKANPVDLILLDLRMPVMDGREFLRRKQAAPELRSIPVIITTADDSADQQAALFSLGANDYIIKPFIPAVVTRRVNNVLESNRRFQEMVREFNTLSEQVKTDRMTGLMNRVSAQELITTRLESAAESCAMVMLDIDNFKQINDTRGHDYGDKVICAVANHLRLHFRREDVIVRMGGDEFAVFVANIPDVALVEQKAHQLCRRIADIQIDGQDAGITCSVGIALSSPAEHSFEVLYHHADKALYSAKCRGRNMVSIYGGETAATSISKWITDAESVLDAINDSIYACDKDSYELIYANDNLCKFAGVSLAECKGKKCYEVLMHKTAPCPFCPLPKITEGKVYTRLFYVPDQPQTLLMRGRLINRNGRLVHLEVAVDVSEVDGAQSNWKGASDDERA
ncbi:MAG: diguanylate cyclase, partial [Oscillibacter sp.]